ncbi:MAG: hypothetical protein AB1679_13090 [Actinomycetota bacterium]
MAAGAPAQAHDNPGDYMGDKKGAKVEPQRTYDSDANRTIFSFMLTLNSGESQVSHVLLGACEGLEIVSVSGPPGANKDPEAPKADNSNGGGGHFGVKYEPGKPGTYTIVFAGNIAGAEFVIKDGTGHKHFPSGQASDVCKPVTTSQTTPTTVGGDTTPTTTGGDTTPTTTGGNTTPTTIGGNTTPTTTGSNPGTTPPGQPSTEVQGATVTNDNPAATPAAPATVVMGTQESQPEALGSTLPRTGSGLGHLAPLGAMLVTLGSVALAAGRRSRP